MVATYADMMTKGGTNDLAVCLNDLGDNIENDVATKMVMDVHAKLSSMNQLELASACPNLALVALNRLTVSNKDKLMHLLLDDYCGLAFTNIDIKSILSTLLKDEPSLGLADG